MRVTFLAITDWPGDRRVIPYPIPWLRLRGLFLGSHLLNESAGRERQKQWAGDVEQCVIRRVGVRLPRFNG
jgi:hypothetical protein